MEATQIQLSPVRAEAIRWLGGWHPLVRQIAPGEGVARPDAAAAAQLDGDPSVLAAVLETYKSEVLLPHELPVVQAAFGHAARGEFKELIALDQRLANAAWLRALAQNSRRAGQAHLARLEPLRDHRGLRRYRQAVESGQAQGWHAVVAGLALGLYAIPLRQGLMDYALHTFWNALEQGGAAPEDAQAIVGRLSEDLTGRIQQLLPAAKPVTV